METKSCIILVNDEKNYTFATFKNVKSFLKHYYLYYDIIGITQSQLPTAENLTRELTRNKIVEIIGNKQIMKIKLMPLF